MGDFDSRFPNIAKRFSIRLKCLQVVAESVNYLCEKISERKFDADIKRDDIREKNLQKAELEIKKRFGKNAIMRGISLEKGATAKERNDQIGGHKA